MAPLISFVFHWLRFCLYRCTMCCIVLIVLREGRSRRREVEGDEVRREGRTGRGMVGEEGGGKR